MERNRNNDRLINDIDKSMDSIYKTVYSANPSIQKRTDKAVANFDNSMDRLITRTRSNTGNNISQLYVRRNLVNKDGSGPFNNINNSYTDLEHVMYTYNDNRLIRTKNSEIDLVCAYLPTLLDALEIKKDAILSADVFNKNYIHVLNTSNEDENDKRAIYTKVEDLKDKYNLNEVLEEAVDDTLKYGESFQHIVDYNTAFNRLLNASRTGDNRIGLFESHSVNVTRKNKDTKKDEEEPILNSNGQELKVTVSNTGLIGDISKDKKFMNFVKEQDSTLYEYVLTESGMSSSEVFLKTSNMQRGATKDFNQINDGLVVDGVKDKGTVKISGSVRRTLEPERVKAIYIEDTCLGYLYIETMYDDIFDSMNNHPDNMMNSMKFGHFNTGGAFNNNMRKNETDMMVQAIARKVSNEIDAKFINNNADLSEEIYTMLRYDIFNSDSSNMGLTNIKVTFIDPSEIIHFYYKKDKITHRGISDLQASLFPAKMYSALYVFTSIGILTRSQDKRAYMVKQHVDSNIAKILLNAINQIKKGNMGVREVNDINNLFNIAGAYTDMFIPESASGERPINFEIIPGQDIDPNDEMLDRLKTMAVNPVGVPEELLDMSVNIEFASRGTTSNSKFARHILKRQSITEKFIDVVLNRLYYNEYLINTSAKREDTLELECQLPPPTYLTIQSTTELFSAAKEMIDEIISMDVPNDEQDAPWVAIYRNKLMKKYMNLYIDYDEKEQFIRDAKVEAKSKEKIEEEY